MPTAELTRKSALLANWADIHTRITGACACAGTPPSEVEILTVTKYASTPDVKILIEAGALKIAGESKVQDARARWTNGELAKQRGGISLHFIGHLQTNKAKAAVEAFDWIDSIDSLKIATEVNKYAREIGKLLPVLIQLKLTTAPTQSGITTQQAGELLAAIRGLENLVPCGYMGIAPAGATREELLKIFTAARKVFDRDFPGRTGRHGFKNYLSLGMSGDFELAIQAGSNLPRIGSALFA